MTGRDRPLNWKDGSDPAARGRSGDKTEKETSRMQFHVNGKLYVRCCIILMPLLFLLFCLLFNDASAPSGKVRKIIGVCAGFSVVAGLGLSFVVCGLVEVAKACKHGKVDRKPVIKTSLVFLLFLSCCFSLHVLFPSVARVLEITLWAVLIAGLIAEYLARRRSAS